MSDKKKKGGRKKMERKDKMYGEMGSVLCWPSSQNRGIDQQGEGASLYPLLGE